jgi:hypothetical protein
MRRELEVILDDMTNDELVELASTTLDTMLDDDVFRVVR